MYAQLGEITFQALTSPEKFSSTMASTIAEHKVLEAAPTLQWTGDEAEKLELEMLFHASFVDPGSAIAALRAALADHQARALLMGNGFFRGYYIVKRVIEQGMLYADNGAPISLKARVELIAASAAQIAATAAAVTSAGLGISSATASGAIAPAGLSAMLAKPAETGPTGPELAPDDVPLAAIVRSAAM
jgi:phage protein U